MNTAFSTNGKGECMYRFDGKDRRDNQEDLPIGAGGPRRTTALFFGSMFLTSTHKLKHLIGNMLCHDLLFPCIDANSMY